MARFKSIVTDAGAAALTALIAAGKPLILTRAAAGSGVATVSPNTLADLVTPENVAVSLGEKDLIEGDPAIMRIPVQVTNEALDAPVWIREVAVYGNTIDNTEVMFCYGWLDGDDSDNVLPATSFEEDADTVHIHDLAVFVTNQEAASVSVQVAPGSYVTREQMTTYAAPLVHTPGREYHHRNHRREHGTGPAPPGQRHRSDQGAVEHRLHRNHRDPHLRPRAAFLLEGL